MKKTKNKILIRMISLMLAVITLIPANIGAIIASAMIVNGTGEGGGSSTSVATSGYSIHGDFAPKGSAPMPVAGMRFSVYNVYTEGPNYMKSSKSIDVFKTKYGFKDSRQKFDTKLNKMQLIQNYYNDKNTAYDTSTTQDNCVFGSNYGIDLPDTVSGMRDWEINGDYFDKILNLIDSGKYPIKLGVTALEYGDRILVEPLFPIRVNSVPYTLTPTEIALLGASMFGTGSNGTGGKAGSFQQGTWSWISEYTNRVYPNSMRLSESFLDKNSGQLLWGPQEIGNGSRADFLSVLANGYGIHIAYTPTNEDAPPPPCIYFAPSFRHLRMPACLLRKRIGCTEEALGCTELAVILNASEESQGYLSCSLLQAFANASFLQRKRKSCTEEASGVLLKINFVLMYCRV